MRLFKFARLIIRFYGSSIALKKLFRLWETLIFLNSSLNPVIYCWRMRHIRRGIIDVLWSFLARDIHPAVFTIGRPMLSLLITEPLHETYMNCVQFFSASKRWQTQEYLPVRYWSQTTMVYKLLIGKDGIQVNNNARFIFDGQWSEIFFDKNKSRSRHIVFYIDF